MASLRHIPAPNISVGSEPRELTLEEYESRIRLAQQLMSDDDLDFLVVYGDREMYRDIYFLTGTDPRFEEAIYVLDRESRGHLLLGNENLGHGPAEALGIGITLYQALSPAGQIRNAPIGLEDVLRSAGIEAGARVGVAGGKTFGAGFVGDPDRAIMAPAYLVDALRSIVSSGGDVVNAQGLFTDPKDGMRTVSSAHQIAIFEYAASVASSSVMQALRGVRPGIAANRLADLLFDRGLPHQAHTMINFGAKQGLYSPSSNTAKIGDAFQIAQGLRGGLTCRSGAVAASEADLQGPARDIFPNLALNYFDVVATWHESVAIGVTGGAVFDAVEAVREPDLFAFSLNPGHYLHLEEWSETTFSAGNTTALRSGTMLQCDVIPVLSAPNINMNIEDGVVLADEALRAEFENDYPELWTRVQTRRTYLKEVIGVQLDESVLPMSNMPLWHTPYVLNSELALVRD